MTHLPSAWLPQRMPLPCWISIAPMWNTLPSHLNIKYPVLKNSPPAFSARCSISLLIALCGGKAVGYAYASPFKERAAYDWAVETSIYIQEAYSGRGYGKALYDILERLLTAQNILNLNACIAYTAHADEYLDNHSADFHAHLGYHPVGTFHKVWLQIRPLVRYDLDGKR